MNRNNFEDEDEELGEWKIKGRKDAYGREVESFREYRHEDGKRSRRKNRKIRNKRNFDE